MSLSTKRPSHREDTRDRFMRQATGTAEGKRRLNAVIDESTYRRIKIKAAEEGRTVSEITRNLWIEYLNK